MSITIYLMNNLHSANFTLKRLTKDFFSPHTNGCHCLRVRLDILLEGPKRPFIRMRMKMHNN